jgi:hypothetical protein
MHILATEICQKKRKEKVEDETHTHCRTWNRARNTEKLGKLEMHSLGPVRWR